MKISDLVNKVEPFKFEYDGFVLEGEFYKFRTTTPKYAKDAMASVPEIPPGLSGEELAIAEKKREDAFARLGAKSLSDTIKSWNAEDDEGNALPATVEVFEQLPQPFTNAFLDFLGVLREGEEKKESAPSASG